MKRRGTDHVACRMGHSCTIPPIFSAPALLLTYKKVVTLGQKSRGPEGQIARRPKGQKAEVQRTRNPEGNGTSQKSKGPECQARVWVSMLIHIPPEIRRRSPGDADPCRSLQIPADPCRSLKIPWRSLVWLFSRIVQFIYQLTQVNTD